MEIMIASRSIPWSNKQ